MSFDYGAEPVGVEKPYKLWPTEGEMTALVDGDMLPYIVGFSTDETRAIRAYGMAKFMYGKEPDTSSDSWLEVMLKQPYFQDKVDHLDSTLNSWVEGAKADSAIVYLTDSASNFRVDVAFSHKYKGERPKSKPPFFYELRTYLRVKHNAVLSEGCEADDLMSIEQHRRAEEILGSREFIGTEKHKTFANSIIASKDKDLNIVPGWHYNPDVGEPYWTDVIGSLEPKMAESTVAMYGYWPLFDKVPIDPDGIDCYQEGELYYLMDGTCQDHFARGKNAGKGKFKRVKTGTQVTEVIDSLKGSGLKFFYSQLICGDNVDNYKGIPGAGAKVALDVLDSCKTEKELYDAVLSLYKSKRCGGADSIYVDNYRGGRTLLTPYQLMLEQGRLAWMQTYPGEIWRAKSYCPSGVEDVWKTE